MADLTREELDELERLHKDATDTSRDWTFYWQANAALDNALKPVARALIAAASKGLEAEELQRRLDSRELELAAIEHCRLKDNAYLIKRAETAERERDEARADARHWKEIVETMREQAVNAADVAFDDAENTRLNAGMAYDRRKEAMADYAAGSIAELRAVIAKLPVPEAPAPAVDVAEVLEVLEPFAVDDESWIGEPGGLEIELRGVDDVPQPCVLLDDIRALAAFYAKLKGQTNGR